MTILSLTDSQLQMEKKKKKHREKKSENFRWICSISQESEETMDLVYPKETKVILKFKCL